MMSAELRRNLWLELSPVRLAIIPLLLALIFWGVGSVGNQVDYRTLSWTALILFTLICTLWGTQLAASGITEEARAQTWDWQRLSSQSPAELMIGKLFGSTVLAWYGGAWCLAAYLVFSIMGGQLPRVSWLCLSITGAIFVHAGSMLMTLGIPPDQRPVHQQKRGMSALRLLIIIIVLQSIIGLGTHLYESSAVSKWYGFKISMLPFMAGSTIFWAAWAVFGCTQRLSTLLRCPTTPAPWLIFVVWCMFYFAGFTHGLAEGVNSPDVIPLANYYGLTAYFVALSLAVLLVLHEDRSPTLWRQWLAALRTRQYRLAWQRTPRWIATLALVFAALSYSILDTPKLSAWLLVSPLLLLLRDSAVLYSLYWTPARTRPELAFSIYLLLVYLLLPFLLSPLKFLFYPGMENPGLTALSFGIEAVLAGAFSVFRWRKFYAD